MGPKLAIASPKVIAVRIKRFVTVHLNSSSSSVTAVSAGGNHPTPVLANASSIQASLRVPLAREVSDMAQVALPVLQSVAGVIPIAGAPLGAAIGGCLTALQTIDKYIQNKDDLHRLTRRLYHLYCSLNNSPATESGPEQSRRDLLISTLEECSDRLTKLRTRNLASTSAAQEILGYFNEINYALQAYMTSSQTDVQSRIENMHSRMENMQACMVNVQARTEYFESFAREFAQRHLPQSVTLIYVKLVDATGREHRILPDQCIDFQQLSDMLCVVLRNCSPDEARVQRQYIEQQQYDFCIDKGQTVTPLLEGGEAWASIEPGTTIVVRVVFESYYWYSFRELHCCPFCEVENSVDPGSSASIEW
ncbi:hypothetical protein HYDPIDRAFT_166008 [Hydnomerulius pinastri MD-312]|nr:hypothetical protein HYDPIDRAFT_166008 [Hydnomerulius pinastri MD-312]